MSFDETSLYKIKTELPGVRRSLFDLAIWKNGLAFRKINFSENGVPIIKIAELNNGIGSNTSFTKGNYDNSVRLCHDDLLFSWSGNPQTSIDIYRYQLNDGWLNQHIFKVTANEELVSKDFLFYLLKYLKSHFIQIASNKQTTGLGHVTIADLKRMSVVIPNKDIQNKVVAFIKPIDDQIQVNNEINKNLEEQAQAIYSKMFIEEANPNWPTGKLSDIANITMGQSPKGDTYNEHGIGTVFFQGRAEFGFRFPQRRLYTTDPKRMAQVNDVLLSVRAPVGDLNVAFEPCCIGRGLSAIHSKDNHQSFVLYTVFSLRHKLDMFNGEGTVFGSINRDSLNSMEIILPPMEVVDQFENTVSPMDFTIRNNFKEISQLEKIRDNLLPLLLSGELDVSEIEP